MPETFPTPESPKKKPDKSEEKPQRNEVGDFESDSQIKKEEKKNTPDNKEAPDKKTVLGNLAESGITVDSADSNSESEDEEVKEQIAREAGQREASKEEYPGEIKRTPEQDQVLRDTIQKIKEEARKTADDVGGNGNMRIIPGGEEEREDNM